MLRQHTADTPEPKRNTRARHCPTTAAIRRLVVERGHLGITNKLVQHEALTCCNRAGTVLSKLTRSGEIHSASVPGLFRHWFASAELARRWLDATPPQIKAVPAPRQRILRRQPPTAAQNLDLRQHDAPVVLGCQADRSAMPMDIPTGVRVQRGPSQTHDARYQCAPGERPFGAGFAAAGIGRDVTTGQQWERRA
jgi:hypothetical protein